MKLSRLQLARFIRIISGHNSLCYFRSKVDGDISPLCRFCLEDNETFDHFVRYCPRFYTLRTQYFLDEIITNNHEWSIRDLNDFSYTPGIDAALQGSTALSLFGPYAGDGSPRTSDDAEGIG